MDINDILSDMKKIEMPDDMQERIIRFVSEHSSVSPERFREMMLSGSP